jgi:hypothetical protein
VLAVFAQPAVAGLTISAEEAWLAHDGQVLISLLPDLFGPDLFGRSASAGTVQTKRE